MNQDKKLLRKWIAQQKALHSEESLAGLSALLLEKVEKHPLFQQAKTVLLYHSLPDEVRTEAFIKKWRLAKRILLPVVVADELVLKEYNEQTVLASGAYGIQEPIGAPFIRFEEIDLAIIPGVAFDKEGNRLGRGKGYYDRLLPKLNTYKIGICFSFQLLPTLPTETFDEKMSEVITER